MVIPHLRQSLSLGAARKRLGTVRLRRLHGFGLWTGVLLGAGLALYGIVQRPAPPPTIGDPAVVALVNGAPISAERYDAALAALAVQERGPKLDTAERRKLLDTLIVEDLLVARALELGLARSEPMARQRLLDAMIEQATADGEERVPDDADLRGYFAAHRDQLAGGDVHQVSSIYVKGDAAGEPQARRIAERWRAGETRATLVTEVGSTRAVEPPATALTIASLREYLGPTAARAVQTLGVGQISEPVRVAAGWRIVRLERRERAQPASFEQSKEAVSTLWHREQRARRLARYVQELRTAATVVVDEAAVDERRPIPARALAAARAPAAEAVMD